MKHLLVLALFALAMVGCGGAAATESTSTQATAGSEQPLVAPGEAVVGSRTTCPVTGEEFVVTDSSPSVQHEGRTYYFCCPHCVEQFQANPSQYLHGAAAPAEGTATEPAPAS